MAKALQARYTSVTFVLGNGVCRQHVHFIIDLRSLLRPVRLPSHRMDPVAIARQALRQIEAEGEVPGLALIRPKLLALIDDRERTTASIVEDRLDPRALIYLLISNVAQAELCTGRHHVYRGTLSGTGQALLSAFIVASERMVQCGLHEQVQHDAEL
jgi:hypothetical protein